MAERQADDEVATRTGRLRFVVDADQDDVFLVLAAGHIGPRLVRHDLERAAAFGREHPGGWWYVVDTTRVVLPNPLNLRYLPGIRRLPNISGYVVVATNPLLRLVARLLGWISRPDAVVASHQAALDHIAHQRR